VIFKCKESVNGNRDIASHPPGTLIREIDRVDVQCVCISANKCHYPRFYVSPTLRDVAHHTSAFPNPNMAEGDE
jgi:hypothetical protein